MADYAEAIDVGEHGEKLASSDQDEAARRASIDENENLRRMEELMRESDEVYDVICYPCSKDGRNRCAVKYCVDCNQHMCTGCITQHNRFTMMKYHSIVDSDKHSNSETTTCLPTQRCTKHNGKLLDTYCTDHDEVCCVVCVAVDHSRCVSKVYIPNVAGLELNDTLSKSKSVFKKIGILEKSFGKSLRKKDQAEDTLQSERAEIHAKVDTIRQLVNRRLDVLQERVLDTLDVKYEKTKAVIDVGKRVLTDALDTLHKEGDNVKTMMSEGNDSSKLVQVNVAKSAISKLRGLQETIAEEHVAHIFFRPNASLLSLIYGIKGIGNVVTTPSCLLIGGKATVTVGCLSDEIVPTISGMCILTDGLIVMTDWENSCLKSLNKRYDVNDSLKLAEQPYDVCCVDDNTVAVTLTNIRTVQYIDTKDKLRLTSSFKSGGSCRGIAYYKGLLYVACGGNRLRKEGKGHIEVYNKSGEPVSLLSKNISYPGHIFVARSKVYVADSVSNLVILDLNGNCLQHLNYGKMVNPMAVCDGPEGQIFLGGWSSHNVFALTAEGGYVKSVLEKEDGIYNIHTMCFDWIRSKLICTMRDSKTAVVFNVLYKP